MKTLCLVGLLLLAALTAFAQEGAMKDKASHADSLAKSKYQKADSAFHKKQQRADSLKTAFSSRLDSLKRTVPGDSLAKANLDKIDSIQRKFYTSTDSLKATYSKPLNKLDSTERSLQHRIDSLQSLKLPTSDLTRKLDSVRNLRGKHLTELNQKMDALKTKALSPLKEVTLPPQMNEPLQKLTGSMQNYKLPVDGQTNIPGLSLPKGQLGNIDLPDVKQGGLNLPGMKEGKMPDIPGVSSANMKGLDQVKDITGKTTDITKAAQQAGGYADDAKNIAKGNLNEVKTIDKTLEQKAVKAADLGDIQKGNAEIGKLKQQAALAQNPDSLKEQATEKVKQEAIQQVRKQAVNHFAGQEQVLQQAMDKMSKVKSKYSEVKSLAELPKHPPNPLKGKPFIERIVPGISFQIQKSNYFLLDVNPLLLYKIHPHWSAGAGWNYRLDFDKLNIMGQQKVYGPRAIAEFKWKKGINLRVMPELMNTLVPNSPDPARRQWVWSVFAGVKKDFTVYKTIKGNTEILYNLYNPKHYSPYADKLAVRFGFEFPMKKKHGDGNK